MRVIDTISYDSFPKQGGFVGKRVEVCYNFDTTKVHYGTIVRADIEYPFRTIIKLDNGNYILDVECQYCFSYGGETT